MKLKLCLLVTLAIFAQSTLKANNDVINLTGAGASFPAPAYTKWIYEYSQTPEAKNIKLNYQSMGSSAGVQQMIEKTVDFGATDDPMRADELKKYDLLQIPMLSGGVVVIVNIPGVSAGDITLSGDVLGEIFSGKIKKWNDRKIRRENRGKVNLPNMDINVISRADGSGTTAIFSDYLCQVSSEFKSKIGQGKLLKFPGSAAQKNPGVANLVMQTLGGIGYVESAYATENKLAWVKMVNANGKTVEPNEASFLAAMANAQWSAENHFIVNLNNQKGDIAWPIVSATYIVLPQTQKNLKKKEALIKYLIWCYEKGGASAKALKYIPMPENVVKMVEIEFKKL